MTQPEPTVGSTWRHTYTHGRVIVLTTDGTRVRITTLDPDTGQPTTSRWTTVQRLRDDYTEEQQ